MLTERERREEDIREEEEEEIGDGEMTRFVDLCGFRRSSSLCALLLFYCARRSRASDGSERGLCDESVAESGWGISKEPIRQRGQPRDRVQRGCAGAEREPRTGAVQ